MASSGKWKLRKVRFAERKKEYRKNERDEIKHFHVEVQLARALYTDHSSLLAFPIPSIQFPDISLLPWCSSTLSKGPTFEICRCRQLRPPSNVIRSYIYSERDRLGESVRKGQPETRSKVSESVWSRGNSRRDCSANESQLKLCRVWQDFARSLYPNYMHVTSNISWWRMRDCTVCICVHLRGKSWKKFRNRMCSKFSYRFPSMRHCLHFWTIWFAFETQIQE